METEKQRIEELVKQLNAASAAYYNGQDEIMPNYEWDALFDELTTLEEKTGYIIKDSPTQNAGYEESGSGQKEPHEYPALSLAKTKQVEELQQWAGAYPIWLSWKLDGLTLVLTYDNGNLVKILTRGNGNLGTNITFLKGAIGGFPQKISYQGHLVVRGVGKMKEWVRAVVAIALLVVMFIIGMKLPMYATKSTWIYIVMAYLFLASVMPMWLLMEPRDYMTTFMLLGMIIGAVVGVIAEHPTMKLNAFSGFNVDGSYLFPTLFVTIACGAVSGFHSLVSSGTSSKTISNEKDMPMVGYGAMVVESLLGVIALVVVGAVAVNGTKPEGTPFSIFSAGVAGFFEKFGIPVQVATVFMTMCVSALALTSLDSVARIGRMSFQELFYGDTTDTSKMPGWQKVLTNKYFATIITLFFGYLLTLGGYNNIWPLFGSANQLLAALVLIALAVFLKTTGRTGWTLYIPMFVMLAVTFTALIQKTIALVSNIAGGQATFLVDGLQFIVAILLMVLGVLVAFSCLKKLFTAKKQEA